MIPGVPYDTVGHAGEWMEYGAVDEHDRLLPPGRARPARLPLAAHGRHGPRLLQGRRGHRRGLPQLHVPHRRRRLRRRGRPRALPRPRAGPHPPPRREHLRGRARVRSRSATPRSSRRPRSASPASSASTRSSSTSSAPARTSTPRELPRVAGRALPRFMVPLLPRDPRRAAQDAQREGPEAPAGRGRGGPPRGACVRPESRRAVTTFQGAGVRLAGDLYPAQPTVMLLHGGGQTRHSWAKTAERLAGTAARRSRSTCAATATASGPPTATTRWTPSSRDVLPSSTRSTSRRRSSAPRSAG